MVKIYMSLLVLLFSFLTIFSQTVEIKIDADTIYQPIDGFGATTGMLVYGSKDNLTPALRAQAIDAVYNQVKLNMGNVSFGVFETPRNATDTWGQRQNDDNDPFRYEWNGFNWSALNLMNQKIIQPGMPLGFTEFYPANSISMRWEQTWLSAIMTSDYQRFLYECSEHVAAGLHYWRDTLGLNSKYMMLFNEPTSGNVELTGGNTQTVIDIIKAVGNRLRNEGFLETKFVVPGEETEERSFNVASEIFKDAQARNFVGAIAYHTYPYGSVYSSIPNILSTSGAGKPVKSRIAIRESLKNLCSQYSIPLWMTEVSHGYVDPRSMDALRGRAIHIHDEFIYANASAYFGMGNMWDMISQQMHFGNKDLYSEESTIVLIDNDSAKVIITGIGYAIGHYSRWISKGAKRIKAVSSDSLVQVSAFINDFTKRIALVVINNSPQSRSATISLNGKEFQSQINGEQSYDTARWQIINPIISKDGIFDYSLQPYSVSSFGSDIGPFSSVKEESELFDFYISPNPAKEFLSISLDGNNSIPNFSICIYDIFGNALLNKNFSSNGSVRNFNMNIEDLSQGIYYFKLITTNSLMVKKFVVIK